MSEDKSPILNSPYEEPKYHYATRGDGSLDYAEVKKGRRLFVPDLNSPIPNKAGDQKEAFSINDFGEQYNALLVNQVRIHIKEWRKQNYPRITRVTQDLLTHWFGQYKDEPRKNLFFAQREAIETAVWLNEVASKSNYGQNIIQRLQTEQQNVSKKKAEQLPRIAFKMATGTGKTVVMAALILYHYLNRSEYKQDTRFADYFLVVAPSITIRDRLGVLQVDRSSDREVERNDYYAERKLCPPKYRDQLNGINSRLVITNYHSFMPKTLKGNKKSPFDGKVDAEGNKQEAKESPSQMVKRVLKNFKSGRRLLVLNDEAHHCYLPKRKGRTKDHEGSNENEKAAVWFSGLSEIGKRFQINNVYDLSATPYYLNGSGYTPYSLFGWVVSDFGLIEAIESGLVKIPFLPIDDTSQELDEAKLKNLYDHVKDKLPKKGRRKRKKEAKKKGKSITDEVPDLPPLVHLAMEKFYKDYLDYEDGLRKEGEISPDLLSSPPVFIVVCNNTSVSREMYKAIAGYEILNEDDEVERVVGGKLDLFSNYDEQTNRPKKKSPTLLIDSEALDDADQINKDFKKIFASEIEEFKKQYASQYGQGTADRIDDADILREVVNTVGKTGKLGGHIRCVVSVSMLTEGWDANTVTHIMGLRAFGSQLLCEQVAGRALRRMKYDLVGYDKEGNPTKDQRKIVKYKFPPEYAQIIGVPFKLFKQGATELPEPVETHRIYAILERQKDHEITFPVLSGYRKEFSEDELTCDYSDVEPYEVDLTDLPLGTTMGSAFTSDERQLKVQSIKEKRDQEVIFNLTRHVLRYHFSDGEKNLNFGLFNKVKKIVEQWYDERLTVVGHEDDVYKRLIEIYDPIAVTDHIMRGVNAEKNTEEFIRPIFARSSEKFGSTRYVNGVTQRDVRPTTKSHVNAVVADSDWEQIAAKEMENLDEILSYVKNDYLGFFIPYLKDGTERNYQPDFLCRCKTPSGKIINLILEISGYNKDKAEKKFYTEKYWLPAVNAVREKYGYAEWHFLEVANDIRNTRQLLIDKIRSIT